MRSAIVLAMLLLAPAGSAQTPAPAAPRPAQPQPSAPAPAPAAPRRAAPPVATRGGMVITVTDPGGLRLEGVHVEVVGASDRSGDTNASGQVSLTSMQAGTYRLRLSGPSVLTFEKEVALRAGQTADVDVTLYPAPPPPPPPPPPPAPPAPPAPVVGPAGDPLTLSVVSLIEKEIIPNNQPRRDTLVACSGNTRTLLVQLNQDQPDRLYDTAEATYYVIAGEGAVRMGGRDVALAAGTFVSLPRGTTHGLVRRGRRPLILLATLSGTPCEEAR